MTLCRIGSGYFGEDEFVLRLEGVSGSVRLINLHL